MPLASAFGPNSISLYQSVPSFSTAVTLSVQGLISDSRAADQYLIDVLENLDTLGPYFVVAPGVALAHAKPSDAVFEVGFSLVKLAEPVKSGSVNDPVSLVFSFCATDAESHLTLLAQFANWLSEPGMVNSLQNASAESVIRSLL